MENLLTSTEIFDTETEIWSDGPELPFPLAFATAVSTPFASFVLGGQTVPGDPILESVNIDMGNIES